MHWRRARAPASAARAVYVCARDAALSSTPSYAPVAPARAGTDATTISSIVDEIMAAGDSSGACAAAAAACSLLSAFLHAACSDSCAHPPPSSLPHRQAAAP